MGGKVSQLVAARRPAELAGLVLVVPAPPQVPPSSGGTLPRLRLAGVRRTGARPYPDRRPTAGRAARHRRA
ncbi:hypothetical protein ACFYRL_13870 [Streptomyces goshikiensis]|uniref:hypothetical protein n=1 Tax=Streptomyces goshikiensis TaxID=1942 RepID=UPI0036B16444